jgi:hypothetical protein
LQENNLRRALIPFIGVSQIENIDRSRLSYGFYGYPGRGEREIKVIRPDGLVFPEKGVGVNAACREKMKKSGSGRHTRRVFFMPWVVPSHLTRLSPCAVLKEKRLIRKKNRCRACDRILE